MFYVRCIRTYIINNLMNKNAVSLSKPYDDVKDKFISPDESCTQ